MNISPNTIFDSLKGTLDHLIASEAISRSIDLDEALNQHVMPRLAEELREREVPILTANDVSNLETMLEEMKLDKNVKSVLLDFIKTIKEIMVK